MVSPFDKLKETPKTETVKKYDPESIRSWLKEDNTRKSEIIALLVGDEKSGKSGLLVDCRTDEQIQLGKKLVIFELNADKGCNINKKRHHNNDPNIIVLDPKEYFIDPEGKWELDRVATMEKLKATIQVVKTDYESGNMDLAAIGFDGLDVFQSKICEGQMRMDEHIDIAGGVSPRYWKKRNKYYDDVLTMLMDIDVDIYFITHYGEKRRDKDTGQYSDARTHSKVFNNLVFNCDKETADKMHQIVEFSDETKIIEGKARPRLKATIISDRRDLRRHMEEHIIAEELDGMIIWNGRALLQEIEKK